METQTDRERLRNLLIHTVLDNCGDMPVGLVRAVLGEVESILISASNNATISELNTKIVR